MELKLRQLKHFKAVFEQKTLAAAAKQLHIAEPPLSKSIRALEQSLDVVLFDRSQHRLMPTTAAHELYHSACALLEQAGAIVTGMQRHGRSPAGKVRVGAISAAMGMLARYIHAMQIAQPSVVYEIYQGEPHYLEMLLTEQTIDMALTLAPNETTLLHSVPLATLTLAAIHPVNRSIERGTALARLCDQPLILLRRSSDIGLYERIIGIFQRQRVVPKIVAVCSDLYAAEALVKAGAGIAIVPALQGSPWLHDHSEPEFIRHTPIACDELPTLHLILTRLENTALAPLAQITYEGLQAVAATAATPAPGMTKDVQNGSRLSEAIPDAVKL